MRRDPEEIETKYLHDFLPIADARVLEIGCGDGRLTWRYAAAPRQVVGIDPDPQRLSTAIRNRPPTLRRSVNFALTKSETLPFPGETFDLAILAWSL